MATNPVIHVVTGAMGVLIPKLFELLKKEYNLQKGVKQDVEFLLRELPSMHEVLRKVAGVPRDQLDKQVKIWADEVRELSYVMEDVVDSFLASVEEPAANSHKLKELLKKMGNLIPKGKARRKIANKIKSIKILVKEVADRRDRYGAVANLSINTPTVDPRLLALFKDQKELVGIGHAMDEITKKLTDGDGEVPKKKLRILSIFGFGGLGKTTLAKVVHEGLQHKFVLKAFISVGQKPDVKKVLRDIFFELDKKGYMISNAPTLDEKQLIQELQELLQNKRYFIVIDDIWDVEEWNIIRCALMDSNSGSIIVTTTRILDVARKSDEVYQLKPLSREHSENLFYTRLYGGKSQCPSDQPVDISEKILQKCGGVPLAIITIASLLDGKPREDWSKVYNSIGFGHGQNQEVDNTRKILLFSYYDLPYYLRPCLLYLSLYPEDDIVEKNPMIWKWVAEGFIKEEPNIGQYELGERYFSELINRSMIQPIEPKDLGNVFSCRVHDLVLDMICLLSEELNFVAVLSSTDQKKSLQCNSRRLAVHKKVVVDRDYLANMCTPQVRSFSVSIDCIRIMPSLSRFGALRILDLVDISIKENRSLHLNHLGSLIQLRYIRLRSIPMEELPEEIGKLKFLQTLDLTNTSIMKLPNSIGLLSQLKCFVHNVGFSHGSRLEGLHFLGNLGALEELRFFAKSTEIVEELGRLTELRTLDMTFDCDMENTMVKDLVKSLGKLKKIQVLDLCSTRVSIGSDCWEGYVPPRILRKLRIVSQNDMLPAWIEPSLLPNLTWLTLSVVDMKVKDMEILGSLPELVSLVLWGSQDFMDSGGLFPKLRYFRTTALVSFRQGGMPNLEFLVFWSLHVARLKRSTDNFVFEFDSLSNLPSLQRVGAGIDRSDAAEKDLDEAKDALELATNAHPNRPSLQVKNYSYDLE